MGGHAHEHGPRDHGRAFALGVLLNFTFVIVEAACGAVARSVAIDGVHAYLAGRPGVCDVHDLHVWAMSTTETALTAHLVMDGGDGGASFLSDVARTLRERFDIEHATLQIEHTESREPCHLASGDAV